MAVEQEQGLQVEIGVTEKRYLQQLARLEAQTMKAATKAERSWKRSNTRVSQSFRQVDRSASGFANGGMRNVALQLSQVGQQATATGDPLRALAIQLPDLAIGFGTFGILAGVAAGALLPFAVNLFSAKDNAEALEKQVEGLQGSVKAYRDAAKLATAPTIELAEEFGDAAGQARQMFEALATLEKLNVAQSLGDVRKGIASTFGNLADIPQDVIVNYEAATERVEDLAERLATETDIELSIQLGKQFETLGDQIAEAQRAISNVRDELGLSEESAREFTAAIAAMQNAQGFEEQAAALRRVRSLLEDVVFSTNGASDEQKQLLRRILESEQALLTFVQAMGDAKTETSNTADEANRLTSEIQAAAQAALDFVAKLGSASLAGLRAEVAALEGGLSKADASVARKEAEIRSSDEFKAAMGQGAVERRIALEGLERELALERERIDLTERRSGLLKDLAASNKPSGGGKTKDPEVFAPGADEIQRLEQQIELIGKSRARVAELQAKWGMLAEAKKRNLDVDAINIETGRSLREEIEAQARSIGTLTAEYEQLSGEADFYNNLQEDLSRSMADAIVEGESLSDVFANLAKQMASAALQAALFGKGALAGTMGTADSGGLLGGIFDGIFGKRATGGPVTAGQPYVVGEHGREVFVPETSGRVVNASDVRNLSSGGGAVNQQLAVHIHENAVDGENRVEQSPGRIDVFLRKMTVDQVRGGGLDGAMRDRFGLRPKAQGV